MTALPTTDPSRFPPEELWKLEALCREPDVAASWWWPITHDEGGRPEWMLTHRQAQEVCDECPVAAECLAFGEAHRLTGMFGGVVLRGGTNSKRNQHRSPLAPADPIPIGTRVRSTTDGRVGVVVAADPAPDYTRVEFDDEPDRTYGRSLRRLAVEHAFGVE